LQRTVAKEAYNVQTQTADDDAAAAADDDDNDDDDV